MHYVAVIDKDHEGAYGVQFPEVPGCYSAADCFDDIVPNAIEALSLFFEDSEPVPPRGIEAARELAIAAVAWAPSRTRKSSSPVKAAPPSFSTKWKLPARSLARCNSCGSRSQSAEQGFFVDPPCQFLGERHNSPDAPPERVTAACGTTAIGGLF